MIAGRKWYVPAALAISLLSLSALHAADNGPAINGQTILDQATEAKVTASSIKDLGEVVQLCHQALEAGLDESGKQFAKNLLAGTLAQRGEITCEEIFDRPTPPANWPRYREMALSDFEESFEIDPEQPSAQFCRARLEALPGGNRDKAAEAVEVAIRLSDKEPALKARCLMLRATLTQDWKARRADLDEAVQLAPHSAEVLRTRGLFFVMVNEPEAAVQSLDGSLAINPKQPDAYEGRGMALLMLKKYDEAITSFDKSLELEPNAAMPYTHRARVHAIRENYDKAIADLNKALKIDPDFEPALLLRARMYLHDSHPNKALADIKDVLRHDADNVQARELHAMIVAGDGKLDEAIEDLEAVRASSPDDADLLIQLGMFYAADQKSDKAVEIFSSVLAKDERNGLAYRGRADAYLNQGKQAEAIVDYEAALKIDAENVSLLNNLAWVLATSPDDKLRDGKRAVELATSACKATEYKQAYILSTLAASYAEAGDFAEAIRWSQKAVEIGPDRQKDQLRKELASYQSSKPWREATPPSATAAPEANAAEQPSPATAAPPATSAKPAKPKTGKRR